MTIPIPINAHCAIVSMNALTRRPGIITLLSDMQGDCAKHYEGRVLRVVGYFHAFLSDNIVHIQDGANLLSVDCALLQPVQLSKGCLYHFIGEADWSNSNRELILRAQVYRCLEGLDFQNYKRALKYVQNEK